MTDTKDSGAASITSNASPSSLSVVASVAKHTRGPWEITTNESRQITIAGPDETDKVVAHMLFYGEGGYVTLTAEDRANAARIVAAVNACEGIATDALTEIAGQLPTILRTGANTCDQLRAQRDALAEALRPFAREEFCRLLGGNAEGEDSPLYGRENALLLIKHFRAARAALKVTP